MIINDYKREYLRKNGWKKVYNEQTNSTTWQFNGCIFTDEEIKELPTDVLIAHSLWVQGKLSFKELHGTVDGYMRLKHVAEDNIDELRDVINKVRRR